MSPRYVAGVLGDPRAIMQVNEFTHPPEIFEGLKGAAPRARWGFGLMSFPLVGGVLVEGSNASRRWVARETDADLDAELDRCNARIERAEAELVAARAEKHEVIEAAIPRLKKVRVRP